MTTYSGLRLRGKCYVRKGTELLKPDRSRAVRDHSPTGFEWGYGGSGPAQLALALLLEEINQQAAVRLHQGFKWAHVAKWNTDAWSMTSDEIRSTVEKLWNGDIRPLTGGQLECQGCGALLHTMPAQPFLWQPVALYCSGGCALVHMAPLDESGRYWCAECGSPHACNALALDMACARTARATLGPVH